MTRETSPLVQAFFVFIERTPMFYAYQMLLLLSLLTMSDAQGRFSLSSVVDGFDRFYRKREALFLARQVNLVEKQRGSKQPAIGTKELATTIRTSPFPRFQQREFLSWSEDKRQLVVQEQLWQALSEADRSALYALALDRLAAHFGDDRRLLEELVHFAFGRLPASGEA
jgi:hypothetical protein